MPSEIDVRARNWPKIDATGLGERGIDRVAPPAATAANTAIRALK